MNILFCLITAFLHSSILFAQTPDRFEQLVPSVTDPSIWYRENYEEVHYGEGPTHSAIEHIVKLNNFDLSKLSDAQFKDFQNIMVYPEKYSKFSELVIHTIYRQMYLYPTKHEHLREIFYHDNLILKSAPLSPRIHNYLTYRHLGYKPVLESALKYCNWINSPEKIDEQLRLQVEEITDRTRIRKLEPYLDESEKQTYLPYITFTQYLSELWRKLDPAVVQKNAYALLPCMLNPYQFFQENNFTRSKAFALDYLKIVDKNKRDEFQKPIQLHLESIFDALHDHQKNDPEIIEIFLKRKVAIAPYLLEPTKKREMLKKIDYNDYKNSFENCSLPAAETVRLDMSDKIKLVQNLKKYPKCGFLLKETPAKHFEDQSFVISVMKVGANFYKYLPESQRDKPEIFEIFLNQGGSLTEIPLNMQTKERVRSTALKNRSACEIPFKYRSDLEFLLELSKKNKFCMTQLMFDPSAYDEKLHRILTSGYVSKNLFLQIPEDKRYSPEVLQAILKSPKELQTGFSDIPDSVEKLALQTIQKNGLPFFISLIDKSIFGDLSRAELSLSGIYEYQDPHGHAPDNIEPYVSFFEYSLGRRKFWEQALHLAKKSDTECGAAKKTFKEKCKFCVNYRHTINSVFNCSRVVDSPFPNRE